MAHKVFSGPSEIIPLTKSHPVFGKSNVQHSPTKEALKKTALYSVLTKRALMSLTTISYHETAQNAVCIWQLPCYKLKNSLEWLVEILPAHLIPPQSSFILQQHRDAVSKMTQAAGKNCFLFSSF